MDILSTGILLKRGGGIFTNKVGPLLVNNETKVNNEVLDNE
ncbi:hypothetical protein [uncultured Photobacterium sp.]|nr:hypothetical protein [uncultured Photobacterium sp.]